MKKLLIVVDYQNDFVDGVLGFPDAHLIEEHIIDMINLYHNNHDDVIYTLDTHYDNYLETEEGINLPIKHCIKGTYGHELRPRIKELLVNDKGFEKKSFGSKELLNYLLNKDYDEIVLLGLVSNMCVLANAVICKSACENAHVVIDALGSSSFDKELESKAYDVLKAIHIEIRR